MIYVLSDIHGNERRFASILDQIRLQSGDTLYVLGDVIDRNPGGIRILRQIMDMPNARMLLGNHEYMMLRALGYPYDEYVDDGNALAHWYRNGGQVTRNRFRWLRRSTQTRMIEYLRGLPLYWDVRVNGVDYKLVHGAPPEAYDREPKYKNETHFAVWKRWERTDPPPGDYTLVFGHTPTRHYRDVTPMEVWKDGRRIGIDCGCAYPGGRLACLRLDDGKIFYSE